MINLYMYLRRRNKIVVPKIENNIENRVQKVYITTAMKNLETYGYTFSEQLASSLELISREDFMSLYKNIETTIIKLVGEKGKMIPMYPNFPYDVMEMSVAEMYFNSIVHYLSMGELIPEYERKIRFPLIDNFDLRVIDKGSEEDFNSIFTNLLTSKTSLSEFDKEDIEWFVDNVDIVELLPKQIYNKEILSFITGLLWNNIDMRKNLVPLYTTATDVLRLAVSLSNGDVSLKEYPKFKSFKRSERKTLLSMLEGANNIEEDMLRYKTLWIRLGEILHPGEYKEFKRVNRAFRKIRNNEHIVTFRSELENYYKLKDIDGLIALLTKRPGEFARNLDRLLRLTQSKNRVYNLKEGMKIVDAFKNVADTVPSSTLLQIRSYFIKRAEGTIETRVFFPKGNVAKAYEIENNLEDIDTNVCLEVVKVCGDAIIKQYSEKEPLGKVFIDESLKDYIVPMNIRNASKSLKSVARGSKFTVNKDTKILRTFIYWKQPKGERVDLDLSAVLYDENFGFLENIFYLTLRDNGIYHSGDIISAPKGASEYIDIDLETIKKKNAKYIAIIVNSFTDTPYCNLPECFTGFMERQDINSGEIYEPKTVINKSDITASTVQTMPMIVDIENMKVIWTDMAIKNKGYINNVLSNSRNIASNTRAMINTVKPNMYDLAILHTLARGEITLDKDNADTVFSLTEGVTPYDTDIIISEYL